MKSRILLVVGMGMLVGWSMPQLAVAQDDDGPGTRTVTVTSFDVPFGQRGPVMDFIVNRLLPGTQLNPHVLTSRVLFHAWGSNADQIVMVVEYASLADADADCGQPCTDYFDANPEPEEGDDGYEEFVEGRDAFLKYYSRHTDEIYVAPMGLATTEGEVLGDVGTPDDGDDD